MLWGEFLWQELQEQGMAPATGPSKLLEPGKQCPATRHCSTTTQLIPNVSLQMFAPRLSPYHSCHECHCAGWNNLPAPSGPSHLYKTPRCHRTAAGLQVQILLGLRQCALPPALLTQEGSPTLPAVLCPGAGLNSLPAHLSGPAPGGPEQYHRPRSV